MKAANFWFHKNFSILAIILLPLSKLYGGVVAYTMSRKYRYRAGVAVLCCGNFIVGGSGKTPTCIALAKLISSKIVKGKKIKVGFLTRGYGRQTKENFIVNKKHTAKDVGDEACVLAKHGVCVVANDRVAGAKMLEAQKVDIIIMDDGFQNNNLYKDFNLVVLDGRQGIGNGACLPAGPLRAPLQTQMKYADAILYVDRKINLKIKKIKQFMARRVIINGNEFRGKKLLAFAGIGNSGQFFSGLKKCGGNVVVKKDFGDHYRFTKADCQKLLEMAKRQKLTLVTTEKDFARLDGSTRLKKQVKVAKMEMRFENEGDIKNLLKSLLNKG